MDTGRTWIRSFVIFLVSVVATGLAGGTPAAELQVAEPGFTVTTYPACATLSYPESVVIADAACSPGGSWGDRIYMSTYVPSDDSGGLVETLDIHGNRGFTFTWLDWPGAMAFSGPSGFFGDVLCVFDERAGAVWCVDRDSSLLSEHGIFFPTAMAFDPTGDFDHAFFYRAFGDEFHSDIGLYKLIAPGQASEFLGPVPDRPLKFGPGGGWGADLWVGSTRIDPAGGASAFPVDLEEWDWAAAGDPWEGDMFARTPGSTEIFRVKPDGTSTLFATGGTGRIVFCLGALWFLENANCRKVEVEQPPPVVTVQGEIFPPNLNTGAQGKRFTVSFTAEDPDTGAALDPALLAPAWLSSVATPSLGEIVLPVPSASPGCDDASEDGIWENRMHRRILARGRVVLVFDQPSDGLCLTMDGSRRDLIDLLAGAASGETATVCVTSTTPELAGPVTICGTTTVSGSGNPGAPGLRPDTREKGPGRALPPAVIPPSEP